ncbi:hypothetical protein PZS63_00630 [Klebsiella aerogenes]|uniref:hypothetical protein n=1 Tax=Klebsiella aerogenes TaxID=548 RepID=UPI002B273A53|nr:hypothetical protein [Klebsiella aerogenes]MEA8782133.1 hypothetical protein [Klebsiella aerogenes]
MRKILVVVLMFFSTIAFAKSHPFNCEGGYSVEYASETITVYKNGIKVAITDPNASTSDTQDGAYNLDGELISNYMAVKGDMSTPEGAAIADRYTLILNDIPLFIDSKSEIDKIKSSLLVQISGSERKLYSCDMTE